ncbi:hypothetical protein D3C75_434310 [compost metagenome]
MASCRRLDLHPPACGRQLRGVVDLRSISALRRYERLQLRKGAAVFQAGLQDAAGFVRILGFAAQHEHLAAENEADLGQVGRSAAAQRVDPLSDLQRVADAVSERLIHIADNRNGVPAELGADVHHRLGQRDGIVQRLHERAAAGLHIEHDGVRAGGDLLAHDGAGDKRDGIHGCGYVPQRVQLLVGRGDVPRLADDGYADFADLGEEAALVHLDGQAGDGLQLVERAAGMAEAAPRHLGDRHTG